MTASTPGICYELSGFRLDPRRRLLSGPDGKIVPLKPKVFDTLLYFVEHADELLDKRTLLAAIWGDVIVEENSLNQNISTLRRALGEDAGDNRFIVTVIGRGYRFVAPVRTVNAEPAATATVSDAVPPTRRPRLLPAAAVAVGAAAVAAVGWWVLGAEQRPSAGAHVVAVLPCVDQSPKTEDAYLASGIHEALIDQVAKAGFHVIARTSVMPYASTAKPIPEIARELSAGSNRINAVIECSARYADGRIRVGVALADAVTSDTLWRETYDRELGDIFAVESSIALRVAQELRVTLPPAQIATSEAVPSRNTRAIDFYFSARRYEQQGTTSWATGAEQYERAVEQDPRFALAYARLALLRISMASIGFSSQENLEKARVAAERAIEIEPDLVQARIAKIGQRAYAQTVAPQVALDELTTLEAQATRMYEFYDIRRGVYDRLGRLEEALADAQRAAELGPPGHVPLLMYQTKYQIYLRRYDDASTVFSRVADIAPDDYGMQFHRASLPLLRDGSTAELRAIEGPAVRGEKPTATLMFFAAWIDGDYETARRLLDAQPGPPDAPAKQFWRGALLHSAGRDEEARPLLESAQRGFAPFLESAPVELRPNVQLALGVVLACLGAADDAVQMTEAGLESLKGIPPGDAFDQRLIAAYAFANAGAADRAFAELDTYLSNPGEWSGATLRLLPLLAPIRDDPRFAVLIAKHTRVISARR